MTKTIRTLQDVADHLGAAHPTNESISRRVYKDTSCGAWAEVKEEPVLVKRRFRARFCTFALRGTVLESLHQGKTKVDLATLPSQLVSFLAVSPSTAQHKLPGDLVTTDDLSSLVDGTDAQGQKVKHSRGRLFVAFTCEVPVGTRTVFRVGSIVEGVDAEVFPETVVLPCTGAQIDQAIECVEFAANDLWQDTHGCDECNTDEHDHRINPDCESCGGDGAMI
jgi:hypothetical protein